MTGDRKKDFHCVLVLLLAAVFFCVPFLMRNNVFGPYDLLRYQFPWGAFYPTDERVYNPEPQDFVHQFHPWRQFYRESLIAGEVPLWNPHQMCGMPFAANDQSAVFYPFNLIYLAMPVAKAFGVSALLHLFMAGLFMFIFTRVLRAGRAGALVAGLAYMFTGWMIVWMPHASKIDAAVWAPLVFALFELGLRRPGLKWKLLCGLALGVQFTAGFLQVAAYTAWGLAIYGIVRWAVSRRAEDIGERIAFRRLAAALAIAAVAGIAVSAVHVFQVLELASQAQRTVVAGKGGSFGSGIPWRYLLTTLMPDIFGNPISPLQKVQTAYTENCCFAGAAVLGLAVLGLLRARHAASGSRAAMYSLATLAALGLLCAPGTPLYFLFYHAVPGAKYLAVNRIIFLYMFAVPALAAFGVREALGGKALADAAKSVLFIGAVGAAGAWAVISSPGDPQVAAWAVRGAIIVFAVSIFGVFVLSAVSKVSHGWFALVCACMLVLFDVFRWGAGFTPAVNGNAVFPQTPSILFLKDMTKKDGRRIHSWSFDIPNRRSAGPTLFPNTATAYALDDIRGYDSLYLKRYQDFIVAAQEAEGGARVPRDTILNSAMLKSGWLDFMGVRWLLSSVSLPSSAAAKWHVAFSDGELPVYVNVRVMPRAFVVRRYIAHNGADADALRSIMRPEFEPRHTVMLHSDISRFKERSQPIIAPDYVTAKIKRPGPNSLLIQAPGPGILVVPDTFSPGWKAWLNGRPADVIRADYTFRAMWLDDFGEHTIRMEYLPLSALAGLAVSLAACGLIALFWVFTKRKIRRSEK